ncbi:hypothetical protein AC249_AIPGENE21380 [Exaiptasia diaphana]|nr:hypothetical protein AC249_AIPGENE21380 [Exaiptasia diaphana]
MIFEGGRRPIEERRRRRKRYRKRKGWADNLCTFGYRLKKDMLVCANCVLYRSLIVVELIVSCMRVVVLFKFILMACVVVEMLAGVLDGLDSVFVNRGGGLLNMLDGVLQFFDVVFCFLDVMESNISVIRVGRCGSSGSDCFVVSAFCCYGDGFFQGVQVCFGSRDLFTDVMELKKLLIILFDEILFVILLEYLEPGFCVINVGDLYSEFIVM